jgi:proline racemase
MAVLHARGQMAVGDELIHSSVIGSEFRGRIHGVTTAGGRPAIVPTIRGSAWVTGFHSYVLDSSDPFPEGYVVADTWGVSGQTTQ